MKGFLVWKKLSPCCHVQLCCTWKNREKKYGMQGHHETKNFPNVDIDCYKIFRTIHIYSTANYKYVQYIILWGGQFVLNLLKHFKSTCKPFMAWEFNCLISEAFTFEILIHDGENWGKLWHEYLTAPHYREYNKEKYAKIVFSLTSNLFSTCLLNLLFQFIWLC